AGNSLNHAGDALDAEVPFAVERGKVDFTPSFDGGEAAHDLLFADLHRAADRAFVRVAVGDRGFDQIFSAEQDPGALRAAESFTAAEGVQIDAHAGVFAKIFDGRNSGGIVEQKGNASLFGDRDGTRETIAERGGIDHRRLRIDGASQIVMGLRNDKFCAHEPNGAIEGDAAAEHDDLALHAGGVGKLPDFRRIGSRHAGGGRGGHSSGGPGSDHAEFGSGELRETSAGGVLKFDQIYKMERGELLGTARFGQFERATEISPGTAGVDERTNAEAGIDIFRAGTMNGSSYFGGDCVLFNCEENGERRNPVKKGTPVRKRCGHPGDECIRRRAESFHDTIALNPDPMNTEAALAIVLSLSCCVAWGQEPCTVSRPTASFAIPHAGGSPELNSDPSSALWRAGAQAVIVKDCSRVLEYPETRTEVRGFWTDTDLYLLFRCPYRELNVFLPARNNTARLNLWDRDVVEMFLGDDWKNIRHYREFEIAPTGDWIDLAIDLDRQSYDHTWRSGWKTKARIDKRAHIWYAAARIPLRAVST